MDTVDDASGARTLGRLLQAASDADRLEEAHTLLRDVLGPDAAHAAQRAFSGAFHEGVDRLPRAAYTRLSHVEPETVRWLWPGRVPLGKLTMLDGDPGLLKSTLALDLAARLSKGEAMPDGTRPDLEGPAGTVLLTAEDGLADTIRPRLDAAGADPDRVVALEGIRPDSESGDVVTPTVEDVEGIGEAIQAVGARLLIVDPLVAYLGADTNSHRDADVRRALKGLAKMADRLGVAVLAIRHLTKGGGSNPKYRGGGSIGLIGAARSGLLVAEDPDAPDTRRVLASTKCNLAPEPPSLTFRPEPARNGSVRIAWEGESEHGAHALLERPTGEERTAREEAADVLRQELRGGPVPVEDLQALADRLGLSFKTFRRAKDAIGAEAVREGFGKGGRWSWRIGGQNGCPPKGDTELSDYGDGPEGQGVSGDEGPIDGHTRDVSAYGDEAAHQRDLETYLEELP